MKLEVGQKLESKIYGTEARVLREYIPGMWELRLWQGSRHIGDVCIGERDISLDYEHVAE